MCWTHVTGSADHTSNCCDDSPPTVKIVVTGGAGFIGANLCRMLARQESVDQVIALDDLSTGSAENLADSPTVELVEGSILNAQDLDRVMAGTHAVVHLAARPSVPRSLADPMATHQVNATGTMMVLEAARRHGAPHRGRGVLLFCVRRQSRLAEARGHGDHARQPLCGQQARH